jgi:hypothetical protein
LSRAPSQRRKRAIERSPKHQRAERRSFKWYRERIEADAPAGDGEKLRAVLDELRKLTFVPRAAPKREAFLPLSHFDGDKHAYLNQYRADMVIPAVERFGGSPETFILSQLRQAQGDLGEYDGTAEPGTSRRGRRFDVATSLIKGDVGDCLVECGLSEKKAAALVVALLSNAVGVHVSEESVLVERRRNRRYEPLADWLNLKGRKRV